MCILRISFFSFSYLRIPVLCCQFRDMYLLMSSLHQYTQSQQPCIFIQGVQDRVVCTYSNRAAVRATAEEGLDFWPRPGFLLSLLHVRGILGPSRNSVSLYGWRGGDPIWHKAYVASRLTSASCRRLRKKGAMHSVCEVVLT